MMIDNAWSSFIGHDPKCLEGDPGRIEAAIQNIIDPSTCHTLWLLLSHLLPQWTIALLMPRYNKTIDSSMVIIRSTIRDTLVSKKKTLQLNKKTTEETSTMLDVLLEEGEFSDEEIVEQMLNILMAGVCTLVIYLNLYILMKADDTDRPKQSEPPSSALITCLCLLCQHPEIQNRLREEIYAHCEPRPYLSLKHKDLDTLPLLNAVYWETLRLYPTTSFTRDAIRDTMIAGQVIPKGTSVMLSRYAINRSPHIWGPDAEAFVPDRWIHRDLEGKMTFNRHGGAPPGIAGLPFFSGLFSCPGSQFSGAEIKYALVRIVDRFSLELNPLHQSVALSESLFLKLGSFKLILKKVSRI